MNKPLPIITQIAQKMEQIEKILLEYDPTTKEAINDVFNYMIKNKGKRFRPLLMATISSIIGTKDSHLYLAAAIEFLHNATLAHDDVIDNSLMRRSRPTLNAKYGTQASVLFGDYLYTKTFKILIEYGNEKISNAFIDTVKVMSEGEITQLIESHKSELSEESYFTIIYAKTSRLIELACEIIPLLEYDSEHEITKSLKSFGRHLGYAFQIIDDIIDYQSDSNVMGKNNGDDFAEGKITLPLINLLKKANTEDREFVLELINLKSPDAYSIRSNNVLSINQLLQKYNCIEYCKKVAQQEVVKAKDALSTFSESIYKNYLIKLVDFTYERIS